MRLKTFGGLWIEGDPAPPPLGPRRMGLLAVVAAAGKRGIGRDRALAILWGESDLDQARHTLSQHLYSLRRETGREWITATPELRLDPSIGSDIGELHDALAAGDAVGAARLYSGEFLDGFHLTGAPEFERWVEEERSRLRTTMARVLEGLATAAEDGQREDDATRWWQRLTALDPFSARYAAGYMRSLARGGDRAKALGHGRQHEELIHRELEVEADPVIRELSESLRAAPSRSKPTAAPVPMAPTAARNVGAEDQPRPAAGRGLRPWRLAAAASGAVAIILLGVRMVRQIPSNAPSLAVGMVRASGFPDSTNLGPILRDMLSTMLGNVSGVQMLANSRIVELTARGADSTPGAMSDAARRAGATEVIEGEATQSQTGLVLTLRRVELDRGVVLKGYTVRAPDIYELVDSATAAIARDLKLPVPYRGVVDVRTPSREAYALYEEGLRALYGYDAAAAYRLMKAALNRDSTFAMAAYFAWQAGRGLVDEGMSGQDMERSRRLAPRASERERLLIEGSIAALDAPLSISSAIADTLSVRFPTDPDGQILLGQIRFNQGDFAGSVAAYDRATVLDSTASALGGMQCRVCTALGQMAGSYLYWDSTDAAIRQARRLIRLRPDAGAGWSVLVEPLLREERLQEAEAALARVNALMPGGTAAGPALNRDRIRWGRFEEADRELQYDLHNSIQSVRSGGRWLLLLSLRNQGRLKEALALAKEGRVPGSNQVVPGIGADGVHLAIVPYEMGESTLAAERFRRMAEANQTLPRPVGFKARTVTWLYTLAGAAYAAAGDTAVTRRLADSVEVIGRGSIFGRDPLLHHFLRGLLLQRGGKHAEAVEEFQRSLFSLTDGLTLTNLMMARSLIALGRGREAIAVLRPAIRGGVDGSNTYVTRTELHEALAQAFEQAGIRDSAVAHYRAVEQAWRHADPQFQARYRRAKASAAAPVQ